MLPKVIVITGPTATGKTALGAALAREIGGEVVSADSMQVYTHMDIGTAKPTAAPGTSRTASFCPDAATPYRSNPVARNCYFCNTSVTAPTTLPWVLTARRVARKH